MKILVGTGGAPHSDTAVRFAAQLATHPDDVVTLLTVMKSKGEQSQAKGVLNRARGLIDLSPEQIHTKVRLGHPAEEIVREAEEGDYQIVVVGERQHHTLMTRFLLGSTAQRVVEHAPHPVVIAKEPVRPVRRLLLCDSGVQEPSFIGRVVEQLGDLIERVQEVTVLHVMSQMSAGPGVVGAQLRASAQELMATQSPEGKLLAQDMQALSQWGIQPRPQVRHGRVVDEVLGEAHEGDYDLVIIGAHHGQGWRRILLDDLAHQIIIQLNRPTLIIR